VRYRQVLGLTDPLSSLIGMFVRGHLLLCYRPRMSSYPPFGKRVNLFRFNVFGTSSNGPHSFARRKGARTPRRLWRMATRSPGREFHAGPFRTGAPNELSREAWCDTQRQ
jgi:hypothetical protein